MFIRFTDTLVRRGGRWQAVVAHAMDPLNADSMGHYAYPHTIENGAGERLGLEGVRSNKRPVTSTD